MIVSESVFLRLQFVTLAPVVYKSGIYLIKLHLSRDFLSYHVRINEDFCLWRTAKPDNMSNSLS